MYCSACKPNTGIRTSINSTSCEAFEVLRVILRVTDGGDQKAYIHNSVLHIGAPKCGSSSIQHHLSMRPDFTSDDGERAYSYVAITRGGKLLSGRHLTRSAYSNANLYEASVATRELQFVDQSAAALRQRLTRLTADGRIAILSSEGWLHGGGRFEEMQLLEKLGLRPNIVVYLRPPLEWFNAAWWQWGAWTGETFDEWWPKRLNAIFWDRQLEFWDRQPRVQRIDVGLATGDVVQEFGAALGCDWTSVERTNSSSSRLLLRFLQNHRELRPVHNPTLEFVLNRWADWPKGRTPWIVHKGAQERIMDIFRSRLKGILRFASPATRGAIESDQRWWSTEPYKDLPVEAEIEALSDAEKDDLIKSLIEGIKRADAANRKLKEKS